VEIRKRALILPIRIARESKEKRIGRWFGLLTWPLGGLAFVDIALYFGFGCFR